VSQFCDAWEKGDAESLPIKARKKAARKVEAVAALVVRRGKALAVRRPSRGLLGGLWDLPGGDLVAGELPRAGLTRALRERVGLEIARASVIGSIEHVFTHRKLTLHLYRASTSTDRIRLDGFAGHKWLLPRRFSTLPHATLTAKALDLVLPSSERASD
jgi:A/G-specific adenine glycosylase